jgi:hypothetical protein
MIPDDSSVRTSSIDSKRIEEFIGFGSRDLPIVFIGKKHVRIRDRSVSPATDEAEGRDEQF